MIAIATSNWFLQSSDDTDVIPGAMVLVHAKEIPFSNCSSITKTEICRHKHKMSLIQTALLSASRSYSVPESVFLVLQISIQRYV